MIENGFELPSEAVFDLLKSVYHSTDAYAADFAQEYPSLEAMIYRLADFPSRPGSLFLVARHRNHLVGFLFIVPRAAAKLRHTADLNMGVRDEACGKGIGNALLGAALSRLERDRIIEIVYLMVRADNLRALRLYEKHGFAVLAVLKRDTKTGRHYHDGVLMRARLPSSE